MSKKIEKDLKNWCDEHCVIINNTAYSRPSANGEVNAWMFTPKNPRPTFVLFAHATGNDCLFPQTSLFQALLLAGYPIFTFDLDGHGRGSTTELATDTVATCVSQAASQAQKAFSLDQFHLIGQSLGGALSLAAIDKQLLQAKSLTLVSVPIYVKKKPSVLIWELLGLCSPVIPKQSSHYGLFGLIPAFGSFKRNTYPVRIAKQGRTNTQLDYVDVVTQTINELKLNSISTSLDTPTLLCYGSFDRIAPTTDGVALSKSINPCELLIAKRETHFTTLFSKLVEKKIVNWLNCH